MFYYLRLLFITIILFFFSSISNGQPGYQKRTLTITAAQPINFGAFSVTNNSGGTVTVGWDGSRTATGSIVLLSMSPNPQPAVFAVKLCQGRNANLSFPATSTLINNNGGSISIEIGPSEKGSNGIFLTGTKDCNYVTTLRVGGTLIIKGKALSGTYTGDFYVAINQE